MHCMILGPMPWDWADCKMQHASRSSCCNRLWATTCHHLLLRDFLTPFFEVLNYLKDLVRDYLIHQVADSLLGKVLWLELHINLELHMVIHEWARLQVQGR